MLAIITQNGTSLINPADLKNSSNSFPVSSSLECSTSIWSPDNSQLYLANSSSIKRYTPSESLLEEIYHVSDAVTCMEMKDKNSILFFAAANKVWSLDCAYSPGRTISSLEPHKDTVTMISMSTDSTLLVSVSASAVLVHNLSFSSHTQLKGLPDRKPVACCSFHRHSTRLLLGIGRDLIVCDSMRPSSPLKTVRIPGGGDIMGIATSPFSKTLVASVTSSGDVTLVDLDKDNGILKAVNVKTALTCCAFTAEGAAIYLGTESGQLLILDLRSLETEPKSFTIGDGGAPIKAIHVQAKSKSHFTSAAAMKVKSSSTLVVKSSPRFVSTRTASVGLVAGRVKSPVRATAAFKIRGGGVTPKKNPFSPVRAPLSETKNLGHEGRLTTSLSPTLPRSPKPLKFQRNKEYEENREATALPPSTTQPIELTNVRKHKPSSSRNVGHEHLGLGSAPESISGHMAAMRVRSGPILKDDSKSEADRPKTATRRVVSESVKTASNERRHRNTSSVSTQNKMSSNRVARMQQIQEQQRSTTPDISDDRLNSSSPELPHEPVTPISLGKNATKAPLASATDTGIGILGLRSPEVTKWARGESQKEKGKEREVEMKKTRFAQHPDNKESFGVCNESEDECGPEDHIDERRDGEQELSLQVSPRRPAALPTWLQSPHRPSGASVNVAAQDLLRNIVHDVMYDFQRETKAEMMGLHLDLVRMGRGWKQELREIMDEWSGDIKELRAENKRLKEENERLRRGY